MVKGSNWDKYLEFESIRSYLNGSIGSKSSEINSNSSLEEKIASVKLAGYLLGVKYFLEEYSSEFNNPFEILDYYNSIRTDLKKINQFKQLIEDYTGWLKEKKGLSSKTSVAYQAQLRGFLSWNGISLKFKNKDVSTEQEKIWDKYGIGYDELKEMSFKVIEYSQDKELKLFLRWLQISGLGSRELISLKIKDLKYKNYDKEFVKISKRRKKTGVKFVTFLYGNIKKEVIGFMNSQIEKLGKTDKHYLFGEIENNANQIYNTLNHRFNSAYKRMIENEYLKYQDIGKKVFTLHKYRHIVVTICEILRIPKPIENLFVAHKQKGLDKNYPLEKNLLKNFKMIQEEIFGVTQSESREQIIKEFAENLIQSISNGGKQKTIFKNHGDAPEDIRSTDFTEEIYMNVLVGKIHESVKREILNDQNFIEELRRNLSNS